MKIKFNSNDYVHVRLTDKGRAYMREYNGSYLENEVPDENGYVRIQLWVLMAACGQHMFITLTTEDLPFETTLYLEPDS